jgi:hypothetical protein
MEIDFANGRNEVFTLEIPSGQYETKNDQGDLITIKLVRFEPDFVRNEDGEPSSRSETLNNPAVHLIITENEKETKKQWLFLKFPDFHGSTVPADYKIQFKNLTSGYATGIQVTQDPGSSFIWIGSITLILGLFISFFLNPSKFVEKSR